MTFRGLITVLALVCSGFGIAVARDYDVAPYFHSQRMIDVDGRRMNLYCTGRGSPTVLLDSGLGGSTADWYKVQSAVARVTRVCSYDRAGMGYSESAPPPRDAAAIVTDLHSLLHRASVSGPYVMVGHSIAGLYVRLFADRYPSEIGGLVLVDPSTPQQVQRFAAISPAARVFFQQSLALEKSCSLAVSSQKIHFGTSAAIRCGFPSGSQLERDCRSESPASCRVERLNNGRYLQPQVGREDLAEIRAWEDSNTEVTREQRARTSWPVIVLTSMKADWVPIAFRAQEITVWGHLHDTIAAQYHNAVNIRIAGSGHYIHWDRPAIVISSIAKVVTESRSNP